MKMMWALMSSGGQVPIPASFQPTRGACIISMYFTTTLLVNLAVSVRPAPPAVQFIHAVGAAHEVRHRDEGRPLYV